MIIQAIGLLDDLDKELNTYAMRVREWYGWHFPELTKIVQDNILYARTVKLMGDRVNAAKLDFSEVDRHLKSQSPPHSHDTIVIIINTYDIFIVVIFVINSCLKPIWILTSGFTCKCHATNELPESVV